MESCVVTIGGGALSESKTPLSPFWFPMNGATNRHLYKEFCSVKVSVFFMFFSLDLSLLPTAAF